MRYCCEKCFSNHHIKDFIARNAQTGDCDYCGKKNVSTISTEELGVFFRECIASAYEEIDNGTGAYYDSEDREYYGSQGTPVVRFSIMDIVEEENVFSDIPNHALVEDIIQDSGPTLRDIQNGDFDPYHNIDDDILVLRNDLFGVFATQPYYTWEHFKFSIKHYNRFFDVDNPDTDFRKLLLDKLKPLLFEYEATIPAGSLFYRARKSTATLDFDHLTIDKELSPAPPSHAQSNRMSPAGISYLYVSSTPQTACKECRCNNDDVIIAEYLTKQKLAIIDFSKPTKLLPGSIFSDNYDHESHWFNHFLELFSEEISQPIDSSRDPTYEYVATQLIAEYIRSLGFDGIGYRSSIDNGINFCFFCGPDLEYCKTDYGLVDAFEFFDYLQSFRTMFEIDSISLHQFTSSGKLSKPIKKRPNNVIL